MAARARCCLDIARQSPAIAELELTEGRLPESLEPIKIVLELRPKTSALTLARVPVAFLVGLEELAP